MNRQAAIFQLDELIDHAKDLIEEIQKGRHDFDGDLSYEVSIGHLLDHIAMAWHYARMSDEEHSQITQEQFEVLIRSIPNFQAGTRLVEPYERPF